MALQAHELFRRYERNPILTASDWPYPVNSVFNPAAARLPDAVTQPALWRWQREVEGASHRQERAREVTGRRIETRLRRSAS